MRGNQAHQNRVVRTGMARTYRTTSNTNARTCPSGHTLNQVPLLQRPRARCDGCGASIQDQVIPACCYVCDLDFCGSCLHSGRSIEALIAAGRYHRVQQPIQHCCMVAIAQEIDPLTAAARGERYNGRRPNYCGRRVNAIDYPDPETYGWTFTGSCEGGRAEFFEKDFAEHGIVKLDFYYTTGTVKTVLDHPRQGVTQLFAKGSDLSPSMYTNILLNPRVHTDVRYRRR